MITQRGIEANPNKFEAIMHMRSPTCLKEVQQLNGKLVALSRFLPRLAEKAKLFFMLLRGAKVFTWNEYARICSPILRETCLCYQC